MRALLLLVVGGACWAGEIYFAQASAGGNNGSNCANAIALSSVSWSAGNTYHLCGTVTSQVAPNASGTAGNLLRIVFETGSTISMSSCGATGCIDLSGRAYVVVDGGVDGVIEATNSGSGLGNGSSVGVRGRSGMNNCEIKNLTINNMYVHSSAADTAPNDYYGIWMDGTNNLIHHNTIKDAMGGIKVEGGSSGNQYYSNVIHNINWGIFESAAHVANSITNEAIYGNEIYDFANWDTTTDAFHHDGIFLSGTSATTDLTSVLVYNNYIHGTSSNPVTCADPPGNGSCMTAYIYINTNSNVSVFNNLLVANTDDPGPNGGWIEMYADSGDALYNNTVIGGTQSGNSNCIYWANGTSAVLKNNILSRCANLIWNSSTTFSDLDYNAYQGYSLSWRSGVSWYNSLANWRTETGMEANSLATTGSANLNADYKPSAGSMVIGAGLNLTSLGIAALNTDKAGIARDASSAWDIGAYQYVPSFSVSLSGGTHSGGKQ